MQRRCPMEGATVIRNRDIQLGHTWAPVNTYSNILVGTQCTCDWGK